MKLNLGCCNNIIPGYINVDKSPFPGLETQTYAIDLNYSWPWKDSSIEYILAHDILEHLENKIQSMNECWRVLIPKGILDVVVPTTNGVGAWQDPTHVSYWNVNSFLYFEHMNVYRERFADAYGIKASFKVISKELSNGFDGEKLHIVLSAVK